MVGSLVVMTTCPTCGAEPCVNPSFCRGCRDADARKAKNRLNRLAWNPPPELPEPPTENPAKQALCGDWAADAWNSPTWKQAAAEYHCARAGRVLVAETPPERLAHLRRLMGDDISLSAAWHELNDSRNRPTSRFTINAVVHSVRERGLSALKEPANLERLSRCDAAAKTEINERIEKLGGLEP
jgi:hypothetical protein